MIINKLEAIKKSILEHSGGGVTENHPLVKAIIQQESAGRKDAVSPKGAKGLMQLMDATGRELAQELGEEYQPYNPKQNIKLGTRYINKLLKKYDNDPCLALAAYNWGMGNVDRLIAKRNSRDIKDLYAYLPDETKNYIPRVLEKVV